MSDVNGGLDFSVKFPLLAPSFSSVVASRCLRFFVLHVCGALLPSKSIRHVASLVELLIAYC